jgi:hypothetical protein
VGAMGADHGPPAAAGGRGLGAELVREGHAPVVAVLRSLQKKVGDAGNDRVVPTPVPPRDVAYSGANGSSISDS